MLQNCQICGNEYNYCFKCKKLDSWRAVADVPDCYSIYVILRDYREGVLTIKEATNKFAKIGITINSDFSKFLPAITRDIKTIISEGTVISTEHNDKPKFDKKNK